MQDGVDVLAAAYGVVSNIRDGIADIVCKYEILIFNKFIALGSHF
ncbi:MAG: hypothetical protein ACI85H_000496 [Paracoccaceae bacterium]|jgi:hypothetical protein